MVSIIFLVLAIQTHAGINLDSYFNVTQEECEKRAYEGMPSEMAESMKFSMTLLTSRPHTGRVYSHQYDSARLESCSLQKLMDVMQKDIKTVCPKIDQEGFAVCYKSVLNQLVEEKRITATGLILFQAQGVMISSRNAKKEKKADAAIEMAQITEITLGALSSIKYFSPILDQLDPIAKKFQDKLTILEPALLRFQARGTVKMLGKILEKTSQEKDLTISQKEKIEDLNLKIESYKNKWHLADAKLEEEEKEYAIKRQHNFLLLAGDSLTPLEIEKTYQAAQQALKEKKYWKSAELAGAVLEANPKYKKAKEVKAILETAEKALKSKK